jgi:hypothetical protein
MSENVVAVLRTAEEAELRYLRATRLQALFRTRPPPEEWPWSSFRFYYLNDSSLLSMDRLN